MYIYACRKEGVSGGGGGPRKKPKNFGDGGGGVGGGGGGTQIKPKYIRDRDSDDACTSNQTS